MNLTILVWISAVVAAVTLTFSVYNVIRMQMAKKYLRESLERVRSKLQEAEVEGLAIPEDTIVAFDEAAASLRIQPYREVSSG